MHQVQKRKRTIIFFFLFLLDRFSKFLVLKEGWGFVNQKTLFGLFSLHWFWLATGFLLFILLNRKNFNAKVWLIFIGGLSNLVDRILSGGVIDFLDIKIIPVFNLADIYITIGVMWMLIDLDKKLRLK